MRRVFCIYAFTSTMARPTRPGRLPCAQCLANTPASSTGRAPRRLLVLEVHLPGRHAPLAQRHAARMDGGTPHLSHPVEKRCRTPAASSTRGTLPRRSSSVVAAPSFHPPLGRDHRRRPGAQAHGSTVGREEADETLGHRSRRRHLLPGCSQVGRVDYLEQSSSVCSLATRGMAVCDSFC